MQDQDNSLGSAPGVPVEDLLAPQRRAESLIREGNEVAHLVYQAGVREGIERAQLEDAERVERTVRAFFAMTYMDVEHQGHIRSVVSASEAAGRRRAARERAELSPYKGGPVRFEDDVYGLREVA